MKTIIISLLLLIFGLTACNGILRRSTDNLTAKQVLSALKSANIPITNEKEYTQDSDPDKLLNQPGQYTEKINFQDARIKNVGSQTNTIKIFKNREDRDKVAHEAIEKAEQWFKSYIMVHKNAVITLDHGLSLVQMERYLKNSNQEKAMRG